MTLVGAIVPTSKACGVLRIAGLVSALVIVLAVLVLAPAVRAATVSIDSARDPSLPPSQDFRHIDSTVDPMTGTWSVAYTFYGPPSADAWGNLGARLFVGASQCADFQAAIGGFQQAATLPGASVARARFERDRAAPWLVPTARRSLIAAAAR